MSKTRQRQITPSLTIKPLSKIENSTDASTCAFNSQEKKGHTGILTPKPIIKNKPTHVLSVTKVSTKLDIPYSQPKVNIPINKKILPNKVHITISLIASPILSDFDVKRNKLIDNNKRHSKLKNNNISECVKIILKLQINKINKFKQIFQYT